MLCKHLQNSKTEPGLCHCLWYKKFVRNYIVLAQEYIKRGCMNWLGFFWINVVCQLNAVFYEERTRCQEVHFIMPKLKGGVQKQSFIT